MGAKGRKELGNQTLLSLAYFAPFAVENGFGWVLKADC
jgi:hypothetical protein